MRHDPNLRGFHAVYRERETNHCPGCGHTHWIIGRFSAECAHCSTALMLAEASVNALSLRPRVAHRNESWAA